MSLSFSLWFTEHWLFFTSPPTQKLNFTLLPNVRSQRTPIQLHLGYLRVNHPSCRSQLSATCRECALQFKCDKWGSERHSLPPADGKQNQSLFVPGTLSFKMRMGPMSSYLIIHVHGISTQEAEAMNIYPDVFNVIIWNEGKKKKLCPCYHLLFICRIRSSELSLAL